MAPDANPNPTGSQGMAADTNMNTGMDDQLARCKVAEQEGWGIVLENRTKDSIKKTCNELLESVGTRHATQMENGAANLAATLAKYYNNTEHRFENQ